MNKTLHLRGTSESHFRIGVDGPSVYASSVNPNTTEPSSIDGFNIGDIIIGSSTNSFSAAAMWLYTGSEWKYPVLSDNTGDVTIDNDVVSKRIVLDGTANSQPLLTFSGSEDTGLGISPSGHMSFRVDNTTLMALSDTQVLITAGRMRVPDGSTAAPVYSFDADRDTGVYRVGDDILGMSTGGINAVTIDASQNTSFAQNVTVGGNLTVLGTTTTVSSDDLAITDNIIVVNDGEAGAGVSLGSAGLQVDRGTATEAKIVFNEASDEWEAGITGAMGFLWTTLNHGAGSGLDADTVDGLQAAAFPLVSNNLSDLDNITTAVSNLGLNSGGANDIWAKKASNLSDLDNITTAVSNLGLNSGGSNDIWVEKTGDTMTGDLVISGAGIKNTSGSAGAPTYTFGSDTDTGLYHHGSNQIGLATNGLISLRVQTGGASFYAYDTTPFYQFVRSGTPALGYAGQIQFLGPNDNDESVVFARVFGRMINLEDGNEQGSMEFYTTGSGNISTLALRLKDEQVLVPFGTLTNPGYGFNSDTNTGIMGAAATMTDVINGVAKTEVTSSQYKHFTSVSGIDGTVSAPSFSFNDDTNTGVYRIGSGMIGFAADGVNVMTTDNGDGTASSVVFSLTDSITLPVGNTTQRPSTPTAGMVRFNSQVSAFEGYLGSEWVTIGTSSTGYALTTNNLSDLTSLSAARTNLGLIAGGVGDIWVEKAGDTMTGNLTIDNTSQLLAGTGSAVLPGISFASDPDTGFFHPFANGVGLSIGGVSNVHWSNESMVGIGQDSPYTMRVNREGTAAVADISVLSAFAPNSADVETQFTAITTQALDITSGAEYSGIEFSTLVNGVFGQSLGIIDGRLITGSGSVSQPSYSFISDPNSGMRTGGADVVALTTGGTDRFTISTSTVTSTLPLRGPDGSAAAPAYSFAADTDTGMYLSSTGLMSMVTGGDIRAQFGSTATTLYHNDGESILQLNRLGSAATDTIGVIDFIGQNSVESHTFGRILTRATNTTDGAEEAAMDFRINTDTIMTLKSDCITHTVPFEGPDGSTSAPTYSFTGDSNSGIYSAGQNRLGFVAGNNIRGEFNTTNFALGNSIDLYMNNNTLIFNSSEGSTAQAATNIDHMWFDNASGTFHFVNNGSLRDTGDAICRAATFDTGGADLAECYEADTVYQPGAVLVIGGDKEVTSTDVAGHTSVAGVVSTAPGIRMNRTAAEAADPLWPFIALAGRVPCMVTGEVRKGDRLVTSTVRDHAMAVSDPAPGSVIGIAMEDSSEVYGMIEIMVRSS